MSVQLLDKTRKINKLLHNNNSHKVVFNDICDVLSDILKSNVLVISKKGKVLGIKNREDIPEIHELIEDKVGLLIDSMLNERLLLVLSTKENVNLTTLGFDSDNIEKYQGLLLPIDIAGERLGTLFLYKLDAQYDIDDIILDEPVAGMDPKSKRELFALIRRLHEERNITVIFVSHDMKDVYEIADRILVMGQGKLVYDGAVEQAFGTPEIVEKLGLEMPEMAKLREALLPEIKLTARSVAGVIEELSGLKNI